ncbi:MAG TPA: PIN domain-containing protein [Thermoanaerobaculia bacterium]|nr:PIN domain-containing protein [Thermoanaerobaculia bacterium]
MKVAFDTSVLVAALVAHHPHHERSIVWIDAAARRAIEGIASWHALAETFAVLTRLPLLPRVSSPQAEEVTLRLKDILLLREPTSSMYRAALRRAADRGVRSGALFDALHLTTAERAGADLLLSFNLDDFARLATPDSPRIAAPPDPPSLKI